MQMILAAVGNTSGETLRIRLADTWPLRFRGLLGRPSPEAGEGLLITRCKAVHTIGMAYAIDVVYLDRDWRVVGVTHSVRPGCFKASAPPRRRGVKVTQVLELRDREAARLDLQPGVRLHRLLEVFTGVTGRGKTHRMPVFGSPVD